MTQQEQVKELCKVYMDTDFNEDYNDDDFVENLELLIQKANEYHANGQDLMPDATYDVCVDLLRDLNPESALLTQVWSADDETNFDSDYDALLVNTPMRSIRTVKSYEDKFFTDFESDLKALDKKDIEMHISFKENGHGIRAVYVYGELVKATSRGRNTTGRDITKQYSIFMGSNVPEWEDEPLVEVRGEVLLSYENYEKAKQFNPNLKSAFTGVASMIRESATTEETELLNFVAYDVLGLEGITFDTLAAKYQALEDAGFEVPYYETFMLNAKGDIAKQIEDKVTYMAHVLDGEIKDEDDEEIEPYAYYTDGAVVSVNDLTLFEHLGNEDKYNRGNVAMKVGRWAQDVYDGVIDHIEWRPGKIKFTPVAVLKDDGVITGTGNKVKNVPLYAPLYLLLVDAYPGNTIYFKYGGEAGVVPCMMDGKLLKTFTASEILAKFAKNVEEVVDKAYNVDEDTDLTATYTTW